VKRKILIVIYIILICFSLKLTFNLVGNTILKAKYNDGEYSESQAKLLTYVNFIEKYIAHYNYGNILYQNGEYEDAIEEYEKALEMKVPKYKECKIRINNALAICKTVKLDEKNQDSISKAIDTYQSAIDVLTEEGCANKNNSNGHSQKAEQLKKDIQKEIERLKKLQQDKDDSKDEDDEKEEEQEEKDDAESIEVKMQQIKEDATKEQREMESFYETREKDITRREKNW